MPLYLWKSSYEIGVPEIDMQHRQLVGMINELYDAMKHGQGYKVVEHLLGSLMRYVQVHFTAEEKAMLEHGYPWLNVHIEQHLDFTNKILQLREIHRQGAEGEAIDLMNYLLGWLRDHITGTDKDFGRFLKTEKNEEEMPGSQEE